MKSKRKNILVHQSQSQIGFFSGLMTVMGMLIGVGSLALLPILIEAFSKQRSYVPTNMLDVFMLFFPWFVLSIGLLFTFSIFAGIYFSHRYAGPLHKIENAFKDRLSGKLFEKIRLRPKDHLRGLTKLFNALLQRECEVEAATRALLSAIESIGDITEAKDETLQKEKWQALVDCSKQLNRSMLSPPKD